MVQISCLGKDPDEFGGIIVKSPPESAFLGLNDINYPGGRAERAPFLSNSRNNPLTLHCPTPPTQEHQS